MTNTIKYIMIILLGLFLLTFVSAYTISRSRVIYRPMPAIPDQYTTTTTTIPDKYLSSSELYWQLGRLKPRGENWAYQAGYQDAVRDFRELIGYPSGFSLKPSYKEYYSKEYPSNDTCFCYNKTYAVNVSLWLKNMTRK